MWEQVPLGDTATFVNGYPFKPSEWTDSGREIIRIQNLTKSGGDSNRFNGNIPERYRVRKGDLLISWSATLGIYEWAGEDAWLNQHIFKVVFDKKKIHKNYFKHMISAKLHELERQVHGATMKHITKGKFDSTLVPLPPLHIQQQIADTLDKADALRCKDQILLQKYDDLAQAIFYEMFGDPVKNEQGWEVIELNDLIEIKPKSITPLELNDHNYVGLEHIQRDTGEISYTESADLKSNKFLFDERSILYGKLRPYLRKVALPNFRGVCSTDILPITPKPSVDRYFVTSILRSQNFTDYATSASVGANLPRVNKDVILSYKTINPSSELQQRYGHQLQRLEKQKELVKRNIDHSEILFGKYLQKYF